MEAPAITLVISLLALAGAGIGVWVSLRERLVRAETKIETLERMHVDQKSEVQSLREWLETQFLELRKSVDRKADR